MAIVEQIPWKWSGEGSIQGEVEFEQLLPEDEDDFAGGYAYEETEPSETLSFNARGLTKDQVDALRVLAKTRLYDWSITDTDGNVWTGLRESFAYKPIKGTPRWEVTLVLKTPPTEPSDS